MSIKRNKKIRELIAGADKDGAVYAYEIDCEDQYALGVSWSITPSASKKIGMVKPFKGDGWKKHLYDLNGFRFKRGV